MNARTFTMNGKTYNTMMEMARELGVKRIYPRDFAKFGIEEVVETPKADKADETPKADKADKADKRMTRKLGTPEQIAQVVSNAKKMNVIEFNDFIKHFSIDALDTIAKNIGVNTWGTITNEPIRRMRLLMEIKKFYYPNEKTPVKPVSDWKSLSVSALIKIANEHNITFKTVDDEKIQRMWVTIALNKAGLNPTDYISAAKDKVTGASND